MPWTKNRPRSPSYGWAHAKARAEAAKRHHPDDPCTRCRHPLGPMGPGLHLDHAFDRRSYLGFAHGAPCPWCGKRCNQQAGAREGRRRQDVTRLTW